MPTDPTKRRLSARCACYQTAGELTSWAPFCKTRHSLLAYALDGARNECARRESLHPGNHMRSMLSLQKALSSQRALCSFGSEPGAKKANAHARPVYARKVSSVVLSSSFACLACMKLSSLAHRPTRLTLHGCAEFFQASRSSLMGCRSADAASPIETCEQLVTFS